MSAAQVFQMLQKTAEEKTVLQNSKTIAISKAKGLTELQGS